MTHNELLDALNMGITMTGNRLATHEEDALMYRKALRAVVELHSPWELENNVGVRCSLCANYDYPCPTIQAIEKELNQ